MLRSGFFNSKNHDRLYYNSELSRLFNSLIIDGVFQNVGSKFIAKAGSGMQVIIPSGMAYFNSTWLFNDTDYGVAINTAPAVSGYSRIDGIFLKMGPADDLGSRENTIYYMAGTAGTQPSRPVPTVSSGEKYVPICYVTVGQNVTSITAGKITNMVGTTSCPFVSGVLKTIDANSLITQWAAQWNEWFSAETTGDEDEFDRWFANKMAEWEAWLDTTTDGMEESWRLWFDSVKDDLATVEVGELKNKVDALTGMYVQNHTLYLPNTAASVSSTGTLVLGTTIS